MKRAASSREEERKRILDELSRLKFNSPVWAYFKEGKRIVRPYTSADFQREYFIPDL